MQDQATTDLPATVRGAAGGAAAGSAARPLGRPDYQALFHAAPCGYLTTDEHGTITQVNDTFLGWTGHARDALLGTKLVKLLPIGDQILWSTHGGPQLAMGGAVAEMAVEVVGADRTRRSALLSASRTTVDAEGRIEDRIVVFSAHERLAYERNLVAALRRAEESEARKAQVEADLRHVTHHDDVTGLPNRTHLLEVLAAALSPSSGSPSPRGVLAVVRIDLDGFTDVNDSLGHAAGDELLAWVADRLRSSVPEAVVVARLSGDEFVAVVRVVDVDDAVQVAHRLLGAVEAPTVIDDLELVATATIGVVVATDGQSADRLLRQADLAVRRGKARGGSCCEVHEPVEAGRGSDRLRLLSDLRRGIERGELRLHHQPRMHLATGAVSGVEALVRWEHPTQGLLPPAAFVDAAESSGLILPLGAWVLETAVAQVTTWLRAAPDHAPVEMAVNLSTRQLSDPGLVDLVAAALARHELPPHLLTLEITETALMVDADRALVTLTALSDLGVGLALDDFGTGYSSLTYLKRFPIDELKIDRSFVAGLGHDAGDTAIVTSCVQLAHALGLRAVAEGVETPAQRDALLALACDQAQGYLFSPPRPAEALESWYRERA